MGTLMVVWVIAQIAAIIVTIRLLINLHKPKQKKKNGKENKS